MPRYFFHIVDGEEIIDDEGTTPAGGVFYAALKRCDGFRLPCVILAGSPIKPSGAGGLLRPVRNRTISLRFTYVAARTPASQYSPGLFTAVGHGPNLPRGGGYSPDGSVPAVRRAQPF